MLQLPLSGETVYLKHQLHQTEKIAIEANILQFKEHVSFQS